MNSSITVQIFHNLKFIISIIEVIVILEVQTIDNFINYFYHFLKSLPKKLVNFSIESVLFCSSKILITVSTNLINDHVFL